jgi:2-isopropylmalate synthase
VKLVVNGVEEYRVAEGDGPVNALDAALRKAMRPAYPHIDEMELEDYKVRIIDSHMGTAAKTRVLILSFTLWDVSYMSNANSMISLPVVALLFNYC